MKKIAFVSHCILNTAAKVVLYNEKEIQAEEALRRQFLRRAIDNEVMLFQLPCPEFTLYGAKRWGHVSNQFDNVFFRKHCRALLTPVVEQLKEYLSCGEMFQVLGFIGVDGSPSCGVDYTCRGNWYGSFEGRKNLDEILQSCYLAKGAGIFIEVLLEMLTEEGLYEQVPVTALFASEPEKCLDLIQ